MLLVHHSLGEGVLQGAHDILQAALAISRQSAQVSLGKLLLPSNSMYLAEKLAELEAGQLVTLEGAVFFFTCVGLLGRKILRRCCACAMVPEVFDSKIRT